MTRHAPQLHRCRAPRGPTARHHSPRPAFASRAHHLRPAPFAPTVCGERRWSAPDNNIAYIICTALHRPSRFDRAAPLAAAGTRQPRASSETRAACRALCAASGAGSTPDINIICIDCIALRWPPRSDRIPLIPQQRRLSAPRAHTSRPHPRAAVHTNSSGAVSAASTSQSPIGAAISAQSAALTRGAQNECNGCATPPPQARRRQSNQRWAPQRCPMATLRRRPALNSRPQRAAVPAARARALPAHNHVHTRRLPPLQRPTVSRHCNPATCFAMFPPFPPARPHLPHTAHTTRTAIATHRPPIADVDDEGAALIAELRAALPFMPPNLPTSPRGSPLASPHGQRWPWTRSA